jgi:hypothetical protein
LVSYSAEAGKRHFVGSYFYTNLSPYGTWIEIDYGVVVWRPTMMRMGWSPYRMGRWIWTYDGWYWDSYESFGYITYHYGRWYYDDYYGWLWYPDYEWAPAWVEWRYDDDYIGWAPLHPYASFSISVGLFFTTTYYTPYYHWHFVNYNRFCDPYVYNYYVGDTYKYRIHSRTKYRTDYTYYEGRVQNRGIDVKYVRTRSGQDIREREIVRVRDSREMDRSNSKNRDEIRTFVVSKEDLSRTTDRKLDVQNDRRKTSLDVSQVQIGERNKNRVISRNNDSVDKNQVKNENGRIRNDNTGKTNDKNIDVKRNDKNKNVPIEKQGRVNINEQNKNRNNDKNLDRNKEIVKQNQNVDKRKEPVVNKNQQVDRNQNQQVDRNKNIVKQNTQTNKQEVRKQNNNQIEKLDVNNNREVNRKNDQQKTSTVTREKKVDDNKKEEDSKTKNRR